MTNFNEMMQAELRTARSKSIFPPTKKSTESLSKDREVVLPPIHIDGEEGTILNAEHGPQQVESLLRYVVDFPTGKAMDDAVDDADAIRHLIQHKRGL
jgi:hypothetical protein